MPYPTLAVSTKKSAKLSSSAFDKYGLGPGLDPCVTLPVIQSCKDCRGTPCVIAARRTLEPCLTASIALLMDAQLHCFLFTVLLAKFISAGAERERGRQRGLPGRLRFPSFCRPCPSSMLLTENKRTDFRKLTRFYAHTYYGCKNR